MKPAKNIGLLFLLLLVALAPLPAFAQSSNGTISGTITDDTGAALPGVSVTATNVATSVTRTVVTNATGHYDTPPLVPGTYKVSVELSGFQPVTRNNVVVNVGSVAALDLRLKAGVSETMTVTAAAPLVETTRSQVSSVVNQKSIENLPVNGRNFIDFALTTPGVVRDPR